MTFHSAEVHYEDKLKALKEEEKSRSLFVVGISLDTRSLFPQTSECSDLLPVIPFAFDTRDADEPLLLRSLTNPPINEDEVSKFLGSGVDVVEDYPYYKILHPDLDKVLKPEFAVRFGVEKRNLRFFHLEESVDLPAHFRHEMGYHLLRLSTKRGKVEIPDRLREAMWNTGNMFLMSVGIDRWIDHDDKRTMRKGYNNEFRPIWGKMPGRFRRKPHKDVEAIDAQLSLMALVKSRVKIVEDMQDIVWLGEGFLFTAEQIARQGVSVEGIIDNSTEVDSGAYPVNSVVFSLL